MLSKELTIKIKVRTIFEVLCLSPLPIIILVWAVPWGGEHTPDWVQAVGSILAIVGAAAFPYWHSRKGEENKKQALLEVLSELTDEASADLWLLTNNFFRPDIEVICMKNYLGHGRAHNWASLVAAIDKLPIVDLPPARSRDLGKIRDAVSFGAFVASELPKWIKEGCSHPEVVCTLRGKRDLLDMARASLPEIKREQYPQSARDIGRKAEISRGFPNPVTMDGVKVYRRFVWGGNEAVVPDSVYIQLIFPYGDQFPFLEKVPMNGAWATLEEANRSAMDHAREIINRVKMKDYM